MTGDARGGYLRGAKNTGNTGDVMGGQCAALRKHIRVSESAKKGWKGRQEGNREMRPKDR